MTLIKVRIIVEKEGRGEIEERSGEREEGGEERGRKGEGEEGRMTDILIRNSKRGWDPSN